MSEQYHAPIMVEEVIGGLRLKRGGIYFDGTVGGGGHSEAILSREETTLIGTDKDGDAIEAAEKRLQPFAGRFTLIRSDFKEYEVAFRQAGVDKLDGVLLDLGISSHQIDDENRGFSYRMRSAPLDMRMDRRQSLTAEKIVNEYAREDLVRILFGYGEEAFAPSIAANIVKEREKSPITTSGRLAEIVERSIPPKKRSAACERKTFQAIRIEVNGELEGLEEAIKGLIGRLKSGGRICVLTFHSLEDRIVKRVFYDLSQECVCPKSFPVCVCGRRKEILPVTKKPLTASENERERNPRSKSAKLRIAEKI